MTMSGLIRDVLFPSAAALVLLFAAAADVAVAEETAAAETAVLAAAPARGPAAPPVSSDVAPSPVAAAEAERAKGVERRCDRTERIGKFRITRCD
jgi:hypothetical protein